MKKQQTYSASVRRDAAIVVMLVKFTILLVIGGIAMVASVGVARGQKSSSSNSLDLVLFRMIDEKTSYEKNRDKFETVTATNSKGRYHIIVARVPSFRVSGKEIRSVRVSKQKIYSTDSSGREIVKDSLESSAGKKPSKEIFPHGFVYKVTFVLNETEGRAFSDFANKNERERFDLRLGNNRLGNVQIIGRFETRPGRPHELTTYLETNVPEKAKEILSPLKDKTTWE